MKNINIIIIFAVFILSAQTTEQIKQAKEVIKKTGMSEVEARAAAKAQGYSDKQIDAAIQKEKVAKPTNAQITSESTYKTGLPDLGKSNEVIQEQPLFNATEPVPVEESPITEKKLPVVDKDDLKVVENDELEVVDETNLNIGSVVQAGRRVPTYFGYDIFKRDPALFQASSVGAVDPDYLIGPGDEIIVMLWGETQFRQVLTVDREGFVFIPEIGQVFVNGLNLSLLESKLFRVLSQSYASINPQGRKPTTFLDVSLGNLRPLRIQVLGEVAQPGAYTVSPSATLFSALYYFNGPTTLGSLRDIRLIRGGKEIAVIDFYDYLLTGKKPKDQKLQLDDVIFIPHRLKTVTIEGEINRSGIYELKLDETLTDIIEMSGGLKITAYMDRAQIDRIVPFDQRAELGMDRRFTDVNLEQTLKAKEGFSLQDGDRIQVFSVLDLRQNVVDLHGAVTRPGSYDLGESLSLGELITKADGLLGDAYMDRVDVVRIRSDFTEELIKLNLEQALAGNPVHDIKLQGSDQVRVYGMTEMVPKTYVSITGHVKRPGRFLLQENMTLYDLIFKAGGFVDEEYKKLTYLERAELVRVKEDSDEKEIIPFNLRLVLNKEDLASMLLRTDDAIRIYSVNEIEGETRYVSITGHVKRPGRYELYKGNMTLYDLIFKAGGFTDPEYKKLTYLKRAELVRVREDGDEKEIIPFNLGLVLNKQDLASMLLRTDDNIIVYSVAEIEGTTGSVTISGNVKNPGTYELFEENMRIYDLLFKAGGFDDPQYKASIFLDRADLIRYNDDRITQFIIPFNLGEVVANKYSKQNFQLNSGDEIRVYSQGIFNNIRPVFIDGVVRAPGKYILKRGMTLKDLILEAGGLMEDVFRYKIEVARIDPKKVNENKFSESFKLEMYNDYTISNIKYNVDSKSGEVSVERADFKLEPYDYVFVRRDPHFLMQRKVNITGAVYYPGIYAIKTPHETISDILKRSGGLRPNAYAIASTFTRRGQMVQIDLEKILKKPYSKIDVKLQDGDIIFVAKQPTMTQVLGEVSSPGFYNFISGKRVNDYIGLAGGFSQDSEKNDIWIRYPNGQSKQYNRWWSNPKVLDGSVITVGKKKDEKPFDHTEFAKELASIMADFAQVALILTMAFQSQAEIN